MLLAQVIQLFCAFGCVLGRKEVNGQGAALNVRRCFERIAGDEKLHPIGFGEHLICAENAVLHCFNGCVAREDSAGKVFQVIQEVKGDTLKNGGVEGFSKFVVVLQVVTGGNFAVKWGEHGLNTERFSGSGLVGVYADQGEEVYAVVEELP